MARDNCVVCNKYLKEIGEQENMMCDECNRSTYEISQEQLKEDEEKYKIFFNFLNQKHNLTCTIEEMDEIIYEANKIINPKV